METDIFDYIEWGKKPHHTKNKLVQRISDGSIIKRFDKTPYPTNRTDVVCPHFLELKWAYGCPYDCSWCFLKGTLRLLPTKTRPQIKSFEKIKKHISTFFEIDTIPEILSTGELADSLMYETGSKSFVEFVVPIFEQQDKHKVMFLTKSDRIENLLKLKSHRQVIVCFSLNGHEIAKRWEKMAPSVDRRIAAAKRLFDEGFEVRVRIDPLVPIDSWEEEYTKLIDEIFQLFTPERITLGSLRGLQSTINNCTDISWTKYLSEKSNWGKKVDFEKRHEIYLKIINLLKYKYNFDKVGLCKETLGMWDRLKMNYKEIICNCVW